MRTLIEHLQKYYGVYLLIVAVLFFILWFPNRAVNRYAIIRMARDGGVLIIDTRTGQRGPQERKREELIKKYVDQWREAKQNAERDEGAKLIADNAKIIEIKNRIIDDKNLFLEDAQEIFDQVK
jgi:hypothetical protein